MFGFRLVKERDVELTIRTASLDVVRACERLAAPMGLERDGDYGKGHTHAARDIRELGDELAIDLHKYP